MSRKVTAVAPANIAFIKYWGAHDIGEGIPLNPSISMTLSSCTSHCTVEVNEGGGADEVLVHGDAALERASEKFAHRVKGHLGRLREWAGRDEALRVAARNSFPSGAGLASSASGFAALATAVAGAFELDPSQEELSRLARRSGSGSAARSALGGYVELPGAHDAFSAGAARQSEDPFYARSLAPEDHWDLRDVIAVVSEEAKSVSSLEGHGRVWSSPYFGVRLERLPDRLQGVRDAIGARDFAALAAIVEEEGVDLHLMAMSSSPPIFYWSPGTLEVLALVRDLRASGIAACSTMDAGPNVHVICPPESESQVADALSGLPSVRFLIRDRVGSGPRLVDEHLL